MRPLLPALLLLCAACSPLASTSAPARYAPAQFATETPDIFATQYAIDAQVRLKVERTETAQAFAIATRTAIAGETQSAGTAMYAAAGATGTAVEYSERLQAVSASQAAATFQAGAATQTATAAGPAMTATRAAQVAQAERDSATWLWSGVVLTAILLIAAGAGAILVYSFGAVQIANSQAALIRERSQAWERETRVIAESTQTKILGNLMVNLLRGEIISSMYLPSSAVNAKQDYQDDLPETPQVTKTGDYALAANLCLAGMYVRARMAQTENPDKWPKSRLPGVAQFQLAQSEGWYADMPDEISDLIPTYASAAMWQQAKDSMAEFLESGPKGTYTKTGELAHLANKLRQAQNRAAMMTNGD